MVAFDMKGIAPPLRLLQLPSAECHCLFASQGSEVNCTALFCSETN